MITGWMLIVAVLVGGLLALAGAVVAGLLVYKTKRDGAPLLTPTSGSVGYADVQGASSFDDPQDEEEEVDVAAQLHEEHNRRFMADLLAKGSAK